jgi:hypothetical protein
MGVLAQMLLRPTRVQSRRRGPTMQYDITSHRDTRDESHSEARPDWSTLLPLAIILLALFLSPFLYDLLETLF